MVGQHDRVTEESTTGTATTRLRVDAEGLANSSNAEQIDAEMEAAGYRRIATFDFLPLQRFQVHAPAPSVSPVGARTGG